MGTCDPKPQGTPGLKATRGDQRYVQLRENNLMPRSTDLAQAAELNRRSSRGTDVTLFQDPTGQGLSRDKGCPATGGHSRDRADLGSMVIRVCTYHTVEASGSSCGPGRVSVTLALCTSQSSPAFMQGSLVPAWNK